MTFYEIDPLIEKIARDTNLFTYLSDCRGDFNVVLGDGRLKLAEAPNQEYGMIVGEAFSSDAIPVHLLTREAIDMYLSKLQDNGVMVFNIANRHLDLQPVLGNAAQDMGLACYDQFDANIEDRPYKLASEYVVMARDEADLGDVPNDERWHPCTTTSDPSSDVWTDDFSNLLSTFKWD
jgi:spermidine synthase